MLWQLLAGKLKLSKILERPQIYLIVDFTTKFLLVAKKDVILVFYDSLFKITYFIATMEEILVEGLAQLFKDDIQKLHGLLESMVLYKEPQFVVELTKKLNRTLEIETKLFISFQPQIDGQIERMN